MHSLEDMPLLDASVGYRDYAELISVLSASSKIRNLMKKGYSIKNVKILYGVELSVDMELKPMYAVVALVREGHNIIYFLIDIMKKRIVKVADIRREQKISN
ncbi:MAG: hypothetical protein QW101_02925 [Ignisphaera sp.]|uniref:Uncharacterized protein n=1 Tax=Ignisphaera aggregans TaxID=334771 RepID=A0A7J3MZ29_9CREN